MKKIILSFSLVIIFALYAIFGSQKVSDFRNSSTANTLTLDSTPETLPNKGKYTDGVYKGSAEDVYYGNVEIEATIANGNITNIQFLQYPNSRGNSMMINHRAMPILRSEAITNQSGNVDIVSGATQTSKGFIKSLNNALAQAIK